MTDESTRPNPQERVTVRFNNDEATEREVRRCALKHMDEGWKVVGETATPPEQPEGSGDDKGVDPPVDPPADPPKPGRGRAADKSEEN